ncbi:MAG TPA: hypothetical protein VML75_14385 [Kofleriaceae bacterium]|nr:hypothetical protein [Kofleriaceae bacterium]
MSAFPRVLLATVAAFGLLAAAAGPAAAQRAKTSPPACGLAYLPMVEGNEWSYEPTDSPVPLTDEQRDALEKNKLKLTPPPAKVIIKVLQVTTEGGRTTITLEESADQLVRKTTLSCDKNQLEMDPQSFFYALEPGGGVMMELGNLNRTGAAFPGSKGFKRGGSSAESLRADITRNATEGSGATLTDGKLALELTLRAGNAEQVATPAGKHKSAVRVDFDLTGRVAVAPNMDKEFELSLARGVMWFQPGIGLVQGTNRDGQWFQLVDLTLR